MVKADLLIQSNAIFTGASDAVFSGGVAIKGNRILAVGSACEMDSFKDESTRIYAFKDALVMPGFNDAHVHLLSASIAEDRDQFVDVSSCQSEDACVNLVEAFINRHPEKEVILGRGWNHWTWKKPRMPTKASLDRIHTRRPICLTAWDQHTMWVNSNALIKSGIDHRDILADGGEIGRDQNGEPNGLLFEGGAMKLMDFCARKPPDEERYAQIRSFTQRAASLGLTSVSDVFPSGIPEENIFQYYQKLEQEDLAVRVHFFTGLQNDLDEAIAFKKKNRSQKIRFCGFKALVDGVAEAHTAYLLEPYDDEPSVRGAIQLDETLLRKQVILAGKEGFPVRLHTIGDAAVRFCLDLLEAVQRETGNKGPRYALEHLENIQPEDIARLSRMGVIASMQPLHFTSNIDGYPILLGKERSKRAWAIKSMIRSGARYAFGSDAPVVSIDPVLGIHAAATRTTVNGYPEGGFNPGEKLSIGEILRGYTSGAAYLEGFENETGVLEPGKLADLTVLSKNLFAEPEVEILNTKVLLTIMDGKVTYEA